MRVIAGAGPNPPTSTLSSAAPVGVVSSVSDGPPGRWGRRRASAAVAGAGTGSMPCEVSTVPAAGRDRRREQRVDAERVEPAHTPTMSTIESSAPTSWKCTSSSVDAVHGASATASASKAAQRVATHVGSGSCADSSIARMSGQCRWAGSSAASTRTPTAAMPRERHALNQSRAPRARAPPRSRAGPRR